jgi:hypothetical protein
MAHELADGPQHFKSASRKLMTTRVWFAWHTKMKQWYIKRTPAEKAILKEKQMLHKKDYNEALQEAQEIICQQATLLHHIVQLLLMGSWRCTFHTIDGASQCRPIATVGPCMLGYWDMHGWWVGPCYCHITIPIPAGSAHATAILQCSFQLGQPTVAGIL